MYAECDFVNASSHYLLMSHRYAVNDIIQNVIHFLFIMFLVIDN